MSEPNKIHYGISVDGAWPLLGACFYTSWSRDNIDYKLPYIWNNNTDKKDEVTCKRCLGMLRTDLRTVDLL